jgi:hypothetical protein
LAITTISKAANDNSEESITDLLLGCLRKLFRHRRAAFLPTSDILPALNAHAEMPWADWRNGQGLSAQKLRSMLTDFKVRSVQLQIKVNVPAVTSGQICSRFSSVTCERLYISP